MQYPDKTLVTFICNSWNIWNIHLQHTCIAIATYAAPNLLLQHLDKNICNIHLKRMKHTVATYAHLLVAAQRRLVDASRGSTARGASGAWHEVRGGFGATVRGARCRGARHEAGGAWARGMRHGAHAVRGRSGATMRGARCNGVRREAQGAGKSAARGGSLPSGRMDVPIGALLFYCWIVQKARDDMDSRRHVHFTIYLPDYLS
jgi:hypothetical protein